MTFSPARQRLMNAEYDRLGVAKDQRDMYTYALGQDGGDVLAMLISCTDPGGREKLDSLTERGVIAP